MSPLGYMDLNRPHVRHKVSRVERVGYALLVFAGVVGVLFVCMLTGCSNTGAAFETLRANGYTKIEITGWSPLSCGDSDGTCTGFEATGPTGQRVHGAVGCGYVFKGCTVRVLGSR